MGSKNGPKSGTRPLLMSVAVLHNSMGSFPIRFTVTEITTNATKRSPSPSTTMPIRCIWKWDLQSTHTLTMNHLDSTGWTQPVGFNLLDSTRWIQPVLIQPFGFNPMDSNRWDSIAVNLQLVALQRTWLAHRQQVASWAFKNQGTAWGTSGPWEAYCRVTPDVKLPWEASGI